MDIQPESILASMPGGDGARPYSGGVALREAREQLGLSVADVANRLKFAPRQIEALESDDFARLPEVAFVRGFVRSYAKLLQIDPVPLLAALPQNTKQALATVEVVAKAVPFRVDSATRKPNILWLVAGLLVAIALGLFIWMNDSVPEAEQTVVVALELPPVIVQPEAVSAVAPVESVSVKPQAASVVPDAAPAQIRLSAKPGQESINNKSELIRLVFDHDSWVEVTDKSGKSLLAQLNLRGSEQRLNGTPPFSLVIGNASNVRLYYRGKLMDLTPYNKAEIAHVILE